jgi:citrate synthase
MLDEAAASGDVTAWAEKKLAAGERLMGFSHRVFRFGDPRATVLRLALDRLGESLGRPRAGWPLPRRSSAASARHSRG